MEGELRVGEAPLPLPFFRPPDPPAPPEVRANAVTDLTMLLSALIFTCPLFGGSVCFGEGLLLPLFAASSISDVGEKRNRERGVDRMMKKWK